MAIIAAVVAKLGGSGMHFLFAFKQTDSVEYHNQCNCIHLLEDSTIVLSVVVVVVVY